jgi:RimJ/RimL family protein N-acetyltransferase
MITTRRIQSGEVELFKKMRLMALQDAPYAFSSTYESALRRTDESWREQAERTAQGMDRATFISFSDEEPVGMAALYRLENQADVGELLQVWVAPGQRGGQAARSLMDAVFTWAGENHFCKIIASVRRENPGAIQFYLKYGFTLNDPDVAGLQDQECVNLVKEVVGGVCP